MYKNCTALQIIIIYLLLHIHGVMHCDHSNVQKTTAVTCGVCLRILTAGNNGLKYYTH